MAIKAIIPAGQTKVTVNGLHQWDYGQILEVYDDDLPALVEIHFACAGMDEAVVRSCSNLAGVASAVIPDHCLEQIAPVVAWVYGIDGTAGQTLRTIVMPVIRRTKPAPAGSVPTYISDKYTELVSAIAEQVDALKEGDVVVSRALKADQATVAVSATEAVHAVRADNASAADYAGRAGNADEATKAATIARHTPSFSDSAVIFIFISFCSTLISSSPFHKVPQPSDPLCAPFRKEQKCAACARSLPRSAPAPRNVGKAQNEP